MAGTLSVQKIQGLATSATPTVVEVSSGHTLVQPGMILQVVNATKDVQVSTTSNTFVDTGIAATITPKFATSKILVNCCCNGFQKSTANTYSKFILLRDSTEISLIITPIGYDNQSQTQVSSTISTTFLDSPATTNATTYKVQFNNYPGTGTVYIHSATGGNSESGITLMEIAQ
jgi:hypothetical protein